MSIKDDLGTRMKTFYENRSKTFLLRRTPVIIRCDGKAFSNFCRRFTKPYDKVLNECLNNTLKYLCSKIQGVKMGQRHSDEMSLLLTDFDNLQTDAFFDYNVQKICSVVASMATAEFCKNLTVEQNRINRPSNTIEEIYSKDRVTLLLDEDWPTFDCRCFNLPEREMSNYFYWRILDAKRNSINMVSQCNFSHNQLQDKTCNEMQEMLFQEKGINWDKLPQEQKSGMICLKEVITSPITEGRKTGEIFERSVWTLKPAPKLKAELDKIVNDLPLISSK